MSSRRRAALAPEVRDPSRPTLASQSPLAAPPGGEPFLRGVIVTSDPRNRIYQVMTSQGQQAMPRILSHRGDDTVLENQTPVMVVNIGGRQYIGGVMPDETSTPRDEDVTRLTGVPGYGGEDATLSRNFGANARTSGSPVDLMPGDRTLLGVDGAAVGALRGKTAVVRGGDLAQMRLFGEKDAVELITGFFRLVTWMGESRYVNEEGRTSFIWRGGADQLTQTGADEERYPIRLDVGATGDMVKFEITTPTGQPLFRFHVNAEGRLEIFAAGGIDQTGGGDGEHPTRIAGSRNTEVDGNDTTHVTGAVAHTYDSGVEVSVSAMDRRTMGGDCQRTVNRDLTVSVGARVAVTAGEGATETVTTGDKSVRVVAGAFSTTSAQDTTLASATKVRARAPSVEVGVDPTSSGVKFEELKTAFDALMEDYNRLRQDIAAHLHPATTGSTSPAPSLSAYLAPYALQLNDAKSGTLKLT
jgi:hypothetical protein